MEKIAPLLKQIPVVLASGSPRRIRILKSFGIEPIVIKPNCSEDLSTNLLPKQEVLSLAVRKNLDVCSRIDEFSLVSNLNDYLVISSDTIVAFGNLVLEKPVDEADAKRMLTMLSGKEHTVYTGCCIYHKKTNSRFAFYDHTDVLFQPFGKDVIDAYVATGIPMDKAGAYGIQDGFKDQVERLNGSEDTVIGFPLNELLKR